MLEIAVIFSVDNSLSFHTDNRKNNFWVSGEKPTDLINHNTGAAEKKIVLNLVSQRQKFCLMLHYNSDESYLHVKKKQRFLNLRRMMT